MKSFFKKIGKELKRGFRKIGKFMNSKIGKIMGGVLLAWNIGSIFASLYKGVAGAATQTAATGAAALTPQVSSNNLESCEASNTVNLDKSSTILSRFAIFLTPSIN